MPSLNKRPRINAICMVLRWGFAQLPDDITAAEFKGLVDALITLYPAEDDEDGGSEGPESQTGTFTVNEVWDCVRGLAKLKIINIHFLD